MNRIFSLKKISETDSFEKKYLLHLFGFKIKFTLNKNKQAQKEIKQLIQKEMALAQTRLLNLMIMIYSSEAELFCIKRNKLMFLFTKDLFKMNISFVQEFLSYMWNEDSRSDFHFLSLTKEHPLYIEHSEMIKNGTFLLKYKVKCNAVFVTSFTKNNDEITVERDCLGKENLLFGQHIFAVNSKRKYQSGYNLYKYLLIISDDERLKILEDFFKTLFFSYADSGNAEYVSGKMFDCAPHNFIYDNGNFYYLDDELETDIALSRGFCIYYSLWKRPEISEYLDYFIKKYSPNYTEDDYKKEQSKIRLPLNDTEERISKNKSLVDKYTGYDILNNEAL